MKIATKRIKEAVIKVLNFDEKKKGREGDIMRNERGVRWFNPGNFLFFLGLQTRENVRILAI